MQLLLLLRNNRLVVLLWNLTLHLRDDMLIDVPAERLLKQCTLVLETSFQANIIRVGEHTVFHTNIIRRYQVGLLPEVLHPADDLSGETFLLKFRVTGNVQDDEDIVVSVELLALVVRILGETTLDGEVFLFDLDTVNQHLTVLDEVLDLLAGEVRQCLLDLNCVLLQLLAQDREICRCRVLHVVCILIAGEDDIPHIKLLANVAVLLQCSQVIQVFCVGVNDDQSLQWCLQTLVRAVTADTTKINNSLHALHLPLDNLIEKLLPDFRERQEMDAAIVFSAELFQVTLGEVGEEAQIDVIGEERSERSEPSAKGKEDLKEGVEGVLGIFKAVLALEATAVNANVPVCGVVDELKLISGNFRKQTCGRTYLE